MLKLSIIELENAGLGTGEWQGGNFLSMVSTIEHSTLMLFKLSKGVRKRKFIVDKIPISLPRQILYQIINGECLMLNQPSLANML